MQDNCIEGRVSFEKGRGGKANEGAILSDAACKVGDACGIGDSAPWIVHCVDTVSEKGGNRL